MKEFMFFIRKDSDETMPPEQHPKFLKACEEYIKNLKKDNRLLSAQPIARQGNIISQTNDVWKEAPFNENNEIIGGYYHILANDLEEAISIAKENPEFKFNKKTRIEVRPIKTKEETTNFVYPTKN